MPRPNRIPESILAALAPYRHLWRAARQWLVYGIVLAALCLLVGNLLPQRGSLVVSAETHGLDILFSSDTSSSWRISDALLCFRRDQRLAAAPEGDANPACDSRLYEAIETPVAEITWRSGTRLRIAKGGTGSPFEALVLDPGPRPVEIDGHSLRRGSRIVLSDEAWSKVGSLLFSGVVTIGAVPSPGSSNHLASGRYDIIDTLPFRNRPVMVRDGSFFPGDQVEFVDRTDRKPVEVNGFLTAAQTGPSQGILVLAYSPSGYNQLKIQRFRVEPAFIASTWSDRALRDPWFVALSTLLFFLVAIMELSSKLLRPEPNEPPTSEPRLS